MQSNIFTALCINQIRCSLILHVLSEANRQARFNIADRVDRLCDKFTFEDETWIFSKGSLQSSRIRVGQGRMKPAIRLSD